MAQTQKSLHATMIGLWGSFANKTTTTDSYVDVGSFGSLFFKTTRFLFTATTQNLKVTIFGSIDGGSTYTETAEAEFTVTTATPVSKTITALYTNLKVQVKPASAGLNGTLATKYMGVSA